MSPDVGTPRRTLDLPLLGPMAGALYRSYRKTKEEKARIALELGDVLTAAREQCIRQQIPWGQWVKDNVEGLSQSREWRFREIYRRRSELFDANNNPRPEVFEILGGKKPPRRAASGDPRRAAGDPRRAARRRLPPGGNHHRRGRGRDV
jgi:hypothetical protein